MKTALFSLLETVKNMCSSTKKYVNIHTQTNRPTGNEFSILYFAYCMIKKTKQIRWATPCRRKSRRATSDHNDGNTSRWSATTQAYIYADNVALPALARRYGSNRSISSSSTCRAHSSKPAARCSSGRMGQTDGRMDRQTDGHRTVS